MLSLSNKLSLTTQPIYKFVNKYSIDFDGVDDRIVTDDADTVAQPTTYSFWCKASETGQNRGVFGHGYKYYGAFHFNYSSDRPLLYLGAGWYVYWNDTSAQDDGEWHHWVVYSDPNDLNNCKLYVDGVLQTKNSTSTSGSLSPYTESLTIGSDQQSGGNSFVGKIDEFAVYDRELTQAEITRMYNTYYSPNRVANGNFAQIGNEEVTNGDFSQIGSELVTNGDFATDLSGWTNGNNHWQWTSQGAYFPETTTHNPLSQTLSNGANDIFKFTFTLNIVKGTANVYYKDASDTTVSAQYTTSGTYTIYTVPVKANTNINFSRYGGINTEFYLDNVSVKEVGQDWSFGDGWSMGDGVAICDGSQSSNTNLQQNTGVSTVGKAFKISYKVSNYTAGAGNIGMGGYDYAGTAITSNGEFTQYMMVTNASSNTSFYITGSSNFAATIDNISVKEVGQHWGQSGTWNSTNYVEFNGSSARLVTDGTGVGINQTPMVVGKEYKLTFDVIDATLGSAKFDGAAISFSSVGSYSTTFTSTQTRLAFYRNSGAADITIDNIVLQELKHDATNLMLNAGDYQSANPLITSTKSMEFDGTDDYLQLSEPFSHTNHTITGWFKTDDNTDTQEIFSAADSSDDGIRVWFDGSSILRYRIGDSASSTLSSGTLVANKWYNFACTYDGTTQTIYIDGVSVINQSASRTISTTTDVRIGNKSWSNADYFNGKITEVGAFNRALTSLEVASLYNQGVPTNLLVNRNNYQSGNPTVFNTKQIDFDSSDDHLEINKSDFLGTSDFTISGWIKPVSVTDNYLLGQGSTDADRWYIRVNPTSKLQFYSKSGNAQQISIQSQASVIANEWLHFVITSDRGALTKIYFNGVLDHSATMSPTATLTNSANFRIGSFEYFAGYWDGQISQVGIWNEVLTADEVSSLYNHGLPIDLTTDQAAYESSANLTGYWRMGSGTLDTYPLIADQTNATLGSDLVSTLQNGRTGGVNAFEEFTDNGGGSYTFGSTSTNWAGTEQPDADRFAIEVGEIYKFTFDYTLNSGSSNFGLSIGNTAVGSGFANQYYYPSYNGSHTVYFRILTANSNARIISQTNTVQNFTLSNLVLKKVQGNPAYMTNMTSSDIENGSPYANIVQNGTFDTDSNWSKQAGWTISGGTANFVEAGGNRNIYQNILTIGKTYKLTYTVLNYVSGAIRNVSANPYIERTANGTYTETFVAVFANLYLKCAVDSQLSIDNVTVEEVNTGLQGYWKMGDGTNDEYPVIYDQVDPTLGSEIIIDTQFNDSNEWNISNAGGTTGWVVSNGQAIMNTDNVSTGRNLLADNSNNLTLGKTYKITIDFADASGSGLKFGEFGGDFNNWTVIPTGTIGLYTFYRVSQYSGRPVLYALSVNQKINSITVKEVQGNPATMTNMVEGNITNQYPLTKIRNYYRMGDGIMDGYPIIQDQTSPNLAHIPTTNVVIYSNTLTQSAVSGNITTTFNYGVAPDGTTTSTRAISNGNYNANVSILTSINNNTKYIISGYFKLNSGTPISSSKLETYSGLSSNINLFDEYQNGNLTSEWRRFIGNTSVSTGTTCRFALRFDSAVDIEFWGLQLEAQSQATPYIKSDGIAAVRKSSTTNLIPYSEDFSQWNNARTTNTANQTTSPIETANGTYFEQNTGETNAGSTYITVTVTSNNHTLSIFAKKKEKDFIVAYDTNTNRTYFNISNGTLGTNNSGGSSKIEDYGNGWYRCSVTYSASAGTTNIAWYLGDTDNSTVVTGSGGVYIWGAQLEQQTQAETYAKTTGLPVTIDLFTENNYGTMTNMSASDIVEDTP